MKKARVMLLFAFGAFFCITANSNTTELILGESTSFYYSEQEVKSKIENSASLLAPYYEPTVQFFVKDNLYQGKRGFVKTIERTEMFFPIIEAYLESYGLPDDLKYLIVVESQANPHAVSNVGAMGLWQLMPETARRYGLIVNSIQDDRKDPRKSTEAALQYLIYLHEFLGNWPLAISAYNCGEGRVKKAIKQANSTDYNKVKQFLPKQTQKYLPAIIAARYCINNYHLHKVTPKPVAYAVKFTEALRVFDKITFREISIITNTPISIIQKLNPSYIKGYVPASKQGNYIALPASDINKLRQFLGYSDWYVVEARF